ncbi:unnamed protein product, partial [marine sediment metagenome]
HTYPWGHRAAEILKIFRENKADITKVCICHIDAEIDYDYCKSIMEAGAFIEFDNFGKEFFIDKKGREILGIFKIYWIWESIRYYSKRFVRY